MLLQLLVNSVRVFGERASGNGRERFRCPHLKVWREGASISRCAGLFPSHSHCLPVRCGCGCGVTCQAEWGLGKWACVYQAIARRRDT